MKPNQFLVALVCTAAITGGAFLGSISSAQACPLSDSTLNSTTSPGQSAQPFKPVTSGKPAAGIALLGGLLAVGGIYWFRRSSQSSPAADEADYESEVVEQVDSERELVGNRK